MKTTQPNQGGTDSGLCGCICGVLLTLVVVFIVLPVAFGMMMAFLGM